jgi:hypothetical protein
VQVSEGIGTSAAALAVHEDSLGTKREFHWYSGGGCNPLPERAAYAVPMLPILDHNTTASHCIYPLGANCLQPYNLGSTSISTSYDHSAKVKETHFTTLIHLRRQGDFQP